MYTGAQERQPNSKRYLTFAAKQPWAQPDKMHTQGCETAVPKGSEQEPFSFLRWRQAGRAQWWNHAFCLASPLVPPELELSSSGLVYFPELS